MSTTLDTIAQPRAVAGNSEATAVEQARAVAEVAAAVKVAQDNPRDLDRCIQRMRQACSQKSLAERAFYSLPRAGGRIEGSTVHIAREIAGCWGNIDYGMRELRRDDVAGESEVIAWAWDQETNSRSSRSFIVPHDRMVGKGKDKKRERLIDLTDIANNNNSVGSRAQREVIFNVLPRWYRDEAEAIAARTLQDGGGKTLAQQVADAVTHFAETYGVTQTQLEERLQRPTKEWTAQDLGVLRVVSGELTRGEKRVADEFPSAAVSKPVTADEIAAPKPSGAEAAPVASGPVEPTSTSAPEPDPADPWASGERTDEPGADQ